MTLYALPYDCYWCRSKADHETDDHPDDLPVMGMDGQPREGEAERLQELIVWRDLVDRLDPDGSRHPA